MTTILDSARDIVSDPIGAVTGDIGRASGVDIDESAFRKFEGLSPEERERQAARARKEGAVAPQITAADVQGAQIQQAGPAVGGQVGAVDPNTGAVIGPVSAAEADAQAQEQFRRDQAALVAGLQGAVAGEGPSVAELQLRAGQEDAAALAAAAAASFPGGNPALAQRTFQEAVAEGARETNQAAALLRAEEQAAARGELAGVLGTARGQDVGVAELTQRVDIANLSAETQQAIAQLNVDAETALQNQQITRDLVLAQAGFDQETAVANLQAATQQAIEQGNIDLAVNLKQAELAQRTAEVNLEAEFTQQQITNELVAFYEQLGFETSLALFQAQQDLQRLRVDQAIGISSINVGADIAESQARVGIIGAAAGGAGAAIGSDVRIKTDIAPAGESEIGAALAAALESDDPIEEFLDALEPYKFRYKKPDAPGAQHGDMIGIMAQDAEKSAAGADMVFETDGGKMLDLGKGVSLLLASSANLNARVAALEN